MYFDLCNIFNSVFFLWYDNRFIYGVNEMKREEMLLSNKMIDEIFSLLWEKGFPSDRIREFSYYKLSKLEVEELKQKSSQVAIKNITTRTNKLDGV